MEKVTYSFCLHNGSLDICQVANVIERSSISLRFGGVKVESVDLIGVPWEGWDPTPAAKNHPDVLRHKLVCRVGWQTNTEVSPEYREAVKDLAENGSTAELIEAAKADDVRLAELINAREGREIDSRPLYQKLWDEKHGR